jgi:hypothetical protein
LKEGGEYLVNDDEIYSVGMMLEEKGLSHSQIDAYFEHHGVKGMRWGERRATRKTARVQGRIDRTKRIAKGTASTRDRVLGSAFTKKGANRQLQRFANQQAKLKEGNYRVTKALHRMQGIKVNDLKTGKKGDAHAKMDGGQKAAVAALAIYGTVKVARVLATRT